MRISKMNVLLVEDREEDIFLVERASRESEFIGSFHAVRDGLEAIQYLRQEGPFADRLKFPMPNIMLIDLKMPRMNGMEFLQWLRAHPECLTIPTIVYSSSSMEGDIREAYRNGANAYFVKPVRMDAMRNFLKKAYEFWAMCECPAIQHC